MEKKGGDAETDPVSPMVREDGDDSEHNTNHSGSTETTNNSVGQDITGNKTVESLEEPPVDWLEPLEEDYDDDDDQSWDVDLEGLARESERSVRGRGGGAGRIRKRGRQFTEEGWEDFPLLGQGWKRRVVLRRSGLSVGQSDIYYMSPTGERLRSRIELLRYTSNTIDLTNFDYKLGKFLDDVPKRGPKRKRLGRSSPGDCGFSSESSFQNEAVDVGDRTYSPGPPFSLAPSSRQSEAGTPSPGPSQRDPSLTHVIPSMLPNRPNGPSKGGWVPRAADPSGVLGICIRCRNSFTGTEGQTSCEKCSKASKDDRNIVFRKWLPCGFCRACQVTEDCGMCASCRNGKLNPDLRQPVRCRRRKCLCPSLKRRSEDVTSTAQSGSTIQERRLSERLVAINTVSKESVPGFKESQYSDSDVQSPYDDGDDDDGDERLLKKSLRSCGRCKGCMSNTDCGICDYCINKPKFGGSNKRLKCRQRQCKRETKTWVALNRTRFTYNRKKMSRRNRECWNFEFSDNEGEQERRMKDGAVGAWHGEKDRQGSSHCNGQGAEPALNAAVHAAHFERETQHVRCAQKQPRGAAATPPHSPVLPRPPAEEEEDQEGPTITQIFSLGGSFGSGGVDLEPELLQLLSALRGAVLPVLWCPVLAEGPRLQLLQCSKLSPMADTAVQIEPGFRFHVSVQGQPLLPTHKVYYNHPVRLTTATEVAALLEDLERYAVCRGMERDVPAALGPVIPERAATCEFLVSPEVKCCVMCKKAQQRQ
ncbi:methyl-CpG-binding domain protein 1b isoform X2 [Brachyhypopomus gauderio]|uniref:methyl-CpG-binding domain protein 1b isoform X2 n=1 Tax=Brachyhypopomus gauderio TaxID=698409 RepID=UPI00404337BA